MYNVKAAVSRLDFGPRPKEMEITDIATGHFVFRPVPGTEVSYEALNDAIENAGYEIEDAAITVSGEVTDGRHLRTPNGQRFHVARDGATADDALADLEPGTRVTVGGAWRSGEGVNVVVAAELRAAGDEAEDREDP